MDLKTMLADFTDIHPSTRYWFGVYVTTLIFAGSIYCYNRWSQKRIYEIDAKLPRLRAYPLIGSTYIFYGSTQTIYEKITKLFSIYGPEPYKLWFGSKLCVAIVKPTDIQIVLNNSNALEKGLYDKIFKIGIGDGLITAPVHKWRKNRRILSPLFNTNSVNNLFPVFITKSQNLIKNLKKELGKTEPFDLWDYIVSYNIDLVCQTTMGYNSKDTSSSNHFSSFTDALVKGTELLTLRLVRPWLYPDVLFKFYLKVIGQYKVIETFKSIPLQIIKEKKELINQRKQNKLCKENNTSNIFLDKLLEINDSSCNLSDDEIKDEVLTIMAAASETSSLTICFCLLMLAIHQDIQDKVCDEIYEVLGVDNQPMTLEHAYKLVYLEQVIKETLRVYTVVPLIIRKLQDDVTIDSGNKTLLKGTLCLIGLMFTHRLPDIYPNPLIFNPDNFSEENIAKRHKYSFIPFSGGPRNCIGYKFSMLSMKVALSTFLRNFSVHTDLNESDIKLKIDLAIRSVRGFPITIRPRVSSPTSVAQPGFYLRGGCQRV